MKRLKRTCGLTVRLTAGERAQLRRAARRAGVAPGTLMRTAGLFFADARRDVRLSLDLAAPPAAEPAEAPRAD